MVKVTQIAPVFVVVVVVVFVFVVVFQWFVSLIPSQNPMRL